LKNYPKIGKWYRVSEKIMKDSEGNSYHALFRKGRENTVAEWLLDAINGDLKDYGTDLIRKKY